MNPEIKEKWVNALRNDPEYIQDSDNGVLKSDCGYCCLGVLCDLYVKEKGIEWDCVKNDQFELDGDNEFPSSSVVEWAGLTNCNPEVTTTDDEYGRCDHTLSTLNDDGYSFKTLADLIEAQL